MFFSPPKQMPLFFFAAQTSLRIEGYRRLPRNVGTPAETEASLSEVTAAAGGSTLDATASKAFLGLQGPPRGKRTGSGSRVSQLNATFDA